MKQKNFLTNTIIAHRGIHYKYLENTLKAFKEAIKRNYTIEFDINLTKDKEIIVFHDSNLKRIFKIDRNIDDLTLEEIKKYKYISTLKEVLELINGKVPIIIDIKPNKGIEKNLTEILDNYKGVFAIQSFNPITIFWFKINRPNYIKGYLIYKFLYLKIIIFILNPDYIATNLRNLENLSKYRSKFITLGYTIQNKKEYQKYKSHADNFICDIRE